METLDEKLPKVSYYVNGMIDDELIKSIENRIPALNVAKRESISYLISNNILLCLVGVT